MINKDDFMALEFIPRASSLSKIMGQKGLGQTGITYIHEYLIEKLKGIKKDFSSKYTSKGISQENESIKILNSVLNTSYVKNEQYYNNGLICGTPDIVDDIIIDIKTSWDLFTFEKVDEFKNIPDNYKYQLLAYMELTGIKTSKLAYCLIDTPDELIEQEIKRVQWTVNLGNELDIMDIINIENKHKHQDYPIKARIITFDYDYNDDEFSIVKSRIEEARKIFKSLKDKKYIRLFK